MRNMQELKDLSKKIKAQNPEIQDIILFGSAVKGKIKPGDIDICILSTSRIPNIEPILSELKEKIGDKAHITPLTLKEFPRHTLFKTLIHEGTSLLSGEPLQESLGFTSKILFWYDLSPLTQTEKVKFFYALKGRLKQKGILHKLKAQSLAKGVILAPTEHDNEMIEFFTQWKIRFNRRRILLEK